MPDIFYFFNLFVNLDVYLVFQGSRVGRAGWRGQWGRAPSTVAGTGAMSSAPAGRGPGQAVALG